jgi:hypothetical protein
VAGARNLRIDQLKLDLRNPRIGDATDQHAAMQALIDDQDYKLANLAENILENGLNPLDRFLVMPDEDRGFIVLEGNRRAAVLKMLVSPTVLTGLDIRPALQKRFEVLAARFDRGSVEPLAGFEVPSRNAGSIWIEQRHRGEDEGRGIVGWSAEAVSRFTGRDPAIQALDFVRKHAELTEHENEALASRFPISTLDRLLSTPAVRKLLGLEIENDKLLTALPAEEAMKPLRRIAVDLATKKVNVTQLKLVKQQVDYVSKLRQEDMPDLGKKARFPRPIDSIFQAQSDAKTTVEKKYNRKASSKITSERAGVVPRFCQLRVTDFEVAKIYNELRRLKPNRFPFAVAALLQLFIERSAKHYLDKKLSPTRLGQHRTVESAITRAAEHMIRQGVGSDHMGRIKNVLDEIKYAAAHVGAESELNRAWDDAQAFLEGVWS